MTQKEVLGDERKCLRKTEDEPCIVLNLSRYEQKVLLCHDPNEGDQRFPPFVVDSNQRVLLTVFLDQIDDFGHDEHK